MIKLRIPSGGEWKQIEINEGEKQLIKYFDTSNGVEPTNDNTYDFTMFSYESVKRMIDVMRLA